MTMLLSNLCDKGRSQRANLRYRGLIDRIHADGHSVENYQFPLIADDRRAGSTLLQRLLGLVDVQTDREVWMLYASVLPGIGPGLLWNYAPEAAAIAAGTTCGGPDIPGHPQVTALNWEAFSRDLHLAHHWSDDLYIHSSEGCVRQGFLERLRSFDWSQSTEAPRGA